MWRNTRLNLLRNLKDGVKLRYSKQISFPAKRLSDCWWQALRTDASQSVKLLADPFQAERIKRGLHVGEKCARQWQSVQLRVPRWDPMEEASRLSFWRKFVTKNYVSVTRFPETKALVLQGTNIILECDSRSCCTSWFSQCITEEFGDRYLRKQCHYLKNFVSRLKKCSTPVCPSLLSFSGWSEAGWSKWNMSRFSWLM